MYFKLEKKDYAFKTFCVDQLLPAPHMHSHIEIAFIKKDGKTLAFADEKNELIEENDIFISFPYQIHFYEDIVSPMTVYVLLISTDLCPEFKEIFKTKPPESPLIKNAGSNPLILTAIETLISCTNNTEPYVETLARGVALMLLSEIFKVTSFSEIQTHNVDILKKFSTIAMKISQTIYHLMTYQKSFI